jgi:hypothetical protein
MSPFEYVFQNHNFVVSDPRLGLNFQTSITGYSNKDYSTAGESEMLAITGSLAKKYFKGARKLPNPFSILNEPRIDPNQHFSLGSLKRAFQSRGSPYEFYHAVRLAYLAGRCNKPNMISAADYCRKWFTNDCVSFAGNYTGVSPSTAIFAYALGYTENQLMDKGKPRKEVPKDVHLSKDVVKIPPRKRMEDIAQGDLLLTFARADKRGLQWRHIAVVESFTPLSRNEGLVSFAEWGWNIAADHTVRNTKVTLHDGSAAADPQVSKLLKGVMPKFRDFNPNADKVVCFNGKAPVDHAPALRIFFDASRLADIESRGWKVAGKPAPD